MTIERVKLSDLSPNPNNPRKSYKQDSIKELAASILANGLLQAPSAKKLRGKKREIIFGSRRYYAHMYLVETGALTADHEIDVDVKEDVTEQHAKELALIENIQREDMNPVDEAEAFADLVKSGAELADIAARVGKSEMTIRRRLALAGLCKEAKSALRKDEITLSVAEALTIGTSAQQREIVADIRSGSEMDADDVRQALLEDRASVVHAIFPIERYKGRIAADLFQQAETSYFDDFSQFLTLQKQAVEEKAEELRQTSAWVEVFEGWHCATHLYDRSKAKKSGVIIHMTPNGKVEIHTGLRKREVAPSVREAIREENAKVRPEYAEPVKRYFNAHKTVAVQAAILGSPRTARILAVVGMLAYAQNIGVSTAKSAGIAFFGNNPEAKSDSFRKLEEQARYYARLLGATDKRLEDHDSGLDFLERSYGRSATALYERIKGLTDADLEGLHLFLTTIAFCATHNEKLDGSADSLFNVVANDLGVNMVDCWRPDAFFLSKRNRTQLEAIIQETGMNGFMKQAKKSEIVGIVAGRFERGETEEVRNWLPGAMMFPATGPDVEVYASHDDDDMDEEGDDYEGTGEDDAEDDAGDDIEADDIEQDASANDDEDAGEAFAEAAE